MNLLLNILHKMKEKLEKVANKISKIDINKITAKVVSLRLDQSSFRLFEEPSVQALAAVQKVYKIICISTLYCTI